MPDRGGDRGAPCTDRFAKATTAGGNERSSPFRMPTLAVSETTPDLPHLVAFER
jgi:hypothetical protein